MLSDIDTEIIMYCEDYSTTLFLTQPLSHLGSARNVTRDLGMPDKLCVHWTTSSSAYILSHFQKASYLRKRHATIFFFALAASQSPYAVIGHCYLCYLYVNRLRESKWRFLPRVICLVLRHMEYLKILPKHGLSILCGHLFTWLPCCQLSVLHPAVCR